MTQPAFKQRLIDEQKELEQRIIKLQVFLNNQAAPLETTPIVNPLDLQLLKQQLTIMERYNFILLLRVSRLI